MHAFHPHSRAMQVSKTLGCGGYRLAQSLPAGIARGVGSDSDGVLNQGVPGASAQPIPLDHPDCKKGPGF